LRLRFPPVSGEIESSLELAYSQEKLVFHLVKGAFAFRIESEVLELAGIIFIIVEQSSGES